MYYGFCLTPGQVLQSHLVALSDKDQLVADMNDALVRCDSALTRARLGPMRNSSAVESAATDYRLMGWVVQVTKTYDNEVYLDVWAAQGDQ